MIKRLSEFNIQWFKIVNGLAGTRPVLDHMMIFLASEAIWIVPVFLLYLWFKKPKSDETQKNALVILTSILISLGLAWTINSVYFHPRPFAVGLGQILIHRPSDPSFPSDHTTILSAIAFALFYLEEYRTGIVFLAFSSLVGFARVFCGVHFPFDILGGYFVGFLGSTLTWKFRKKLELVLTWILNLYDQLMS